MSQSQNKFIISYSVVTVLGAGILGFLAYSAYSAKEEAENSLKNQEGKLATLQKAPLYPSDKNVADKRDQVDSFSVEVDKLHNALIGYQSALDNETTADKVSEKFGGFKSRLELTAKGRNIKLPVDFNLGLARYLTGAPIKEAAPQVNYLGTSVNTLLTILFNNGISSLEEIQCPEMPYEKDTTPSAVSVSTDPKKKAAVAAKPKAKGKGAEAPKVELPVLEESKVLNRYNVHLKFTGSEKSVQDSLNQLSTLPEGGPFFIINLLRVENEKSLGPRKGESFAPQPVQQEAGTTAEPSKALVDSRFIVGNEKISVFLDLDLIRFIDPSVAKDSETPAGK